MLAFLLLAAATQALAQPTRETPNRIVEITFEGVVQVEKGQLQTAIASRVDNPLVPETVTRDVRALYALGYFQNVRADAQAIPGTGYRLIFVVQERPRVSALTITGNSIVPTKKLQEVMTLKIGSVFSQSLLDSNLDKIRAAYRDKGYYKVKLTSQVDKPNEQQYAVTIRVEESPRIYITDIRTHGNHLFTNLEIQRFMASAEVDCFDFISDSGVFDENKVNQDMQLITSEYLKRGYIRVYIEKPKVQIYHHRDFSKLIIDFTITEGDQYFVGNVDITGDILGDKKELMAPLLLRTGDPYNPFAQNADQFGLTEHYGEQGYAFAQVIPDRRINDQTHIVDVTYQIRKGEKAYIGRIEFQGNRETRDFVLRREFLVRENELFNATKLRESQQNLRILGFFKPSMAVETEPTDVGNVLDIVTRMEEAQTGTLQAQLGYSDQSGAIIAFSVSKGNLGGRGQTLRFTSEFAERFVRRSFLLDFIEPHLFDTNYSYESTLNYLNRDDITELNRGIITDVTGSQGFGYLLLPRLRLGFTYEATNRSFSNQGFASLQLRTFTTSLTYRTVNSPVFPTEGSLMSAAVSQVGGEVLQGSTEYRRYNLNLQKFYSVNKSSSVILMIRGRAGWLEEIGDNQIPIEDRFRIGGLQTLRGYNFLEVGGPYGVLERSLNSVSVPEVGPNGQPVVDGSGNIVFTNVDRRTIGLNESQLAQLKSGGIQQRIFNIELVFPLTSEQIRGVVFYDAGQVNAEPIQYTLLKEKEPQFFDLLQSYGAGIRMITPLGVFRFEYGVKINPLPHESPDKFDFTVSTLF